MAGSAVTARRRRKAKLVGPAGGEERVGLLIVGPPSPRCGSPDPVTVPAALAAGRSDRC